MPLIDVFPPIARIQDMHEVEYLKTYCDTDMAALSPPLIDVVTPQPQTSKVFFAKLSQQKPKKKPAHISKRVSRPRKAKG